MEDIDRKSSHIFVILMLLGGLMTMSFTQTNYFKGKWSVETVDGAPIVGDPNRLLIDYEGNPHIAYIDKQYSTLKYAFLNDTGWEIDDFQSELSIGGITAFYLNTDNNVCIILPPENYGFAWNNNPSRMAIKNPDGWDITNMTTNQSSTDFEKIMPDDDYVLMEGFSAVHPTIGFTVHAINGNHVTEYSIPVPGYYSLNSYDFDSEGYLHVTFQDMHAYYNDSYAANYYSAYKDGQWNNLYFENTTEFREGHFYYPSYTLLLDEDDNPSLFYLDEYDTLCKKTLIEGDWIDYIVYPESPTNNTNTTDWRRHYPVTDQIYRYDSNGNLNIFFIDEIKEEFIHGQQSGNEWTFETIKGSQNMGSYSVQFDNDDNIHISYYDTNIDGLKYMFGDSGKYDSLIFMGNALAIALVIIWLVYRQKSSKGNHPD